MDLADGKKALERATYIPVSDVILVEVLETHEDLAKVAAGAVETHRYDRRIRRFGQVEQDPTWAVLKHLKERNKDGSAECYVTGS